MTEPSFHWYCFSFRFMNDAVSRVACTYVGYNFKPHLISKMEINEQKYRAEMPSSAVLLGITYLGFGTKKEMEGD